MKFKEAFDTGQKIRIAPWGENEWIKKTSIGSYINNKHTESTEIPLRWLQRNDWELYQEPSDEILNEIAELFDESYVDRAWLADHIEIDLDTICKGVILKINNLNFERYKTLQELMSK